MTFTDSTQTADGPIPHLRNPHTGVLMPVKLERVPRGERWAIVMRRRNPVPQRALGCLVYALPGGAEYIDR